MGIRGGGISLASLRHRVSFGRDVEKLVFLLFQEMRRAHVKIAIAIKSARATVVLQEVVVVAVVTTTKSSCQKLASNEDCELALLRTF